MTPRLFCSVENWILIQRGLDALADHVGGLPIEQLAELRRLIAQANNHRRFVIEVENDPGELHAAAYACVTCGRIGTPAD